MVADASVHHSRNVVIAALVGRLDLDELARTIVTRFLPDIPGYARMSDELLQGHILDIVRQNLDLFLLCLIDDREPRASDIATLRASATQRGREGVPLEDLLRGYRLGARVSWEKLVETCDGVEEQTLLLEVAERIMGYVDFVSTAVAQAYVDEREQLVSEHERWARALFDGLIGAAPIEDLRLLAEKSGVPLVDSYRPFSFALLDGSPRDHASAAIALRSRGVLALTEGDRVCGVVPENVRTLPISLERAAATLGEPAARPGLAAGVELARLRVDTARRLGRVGIIGEFDLLPELLLVGAPELGARLVERVLVPLEEYAEKRGGDLLLTLETYLETARDRRRSADRLSVHPNTLDYRMQRIEQLARVDLDDPGDLTLVYLALRHRQLDPRRTPG